MTTVHVIGAGLAGLACAVRCATAGRKIALYEAAGHAGGRCRSYDDAVLGCRIDNGTHVLVGANHAAFRFLGRIGAVDRLAALGADGVPFVDLGTAERWRARIGGGAVPWWVALRSRRIPGTGAREYLRLYRLFGAPADATVAGCLGNGPLMDRLWRPLTEAALNTAPEEASARLLVPVVRGLLLGGPAAARIHIAAAGLGDTFVVPALARLARAGTMPRFGARLRAIEQGEGRVTALGFDGAEVPCGPSDAVILAVPGHVAADLFHGLVVPQGFRPIVNVHFRLDSEPLGAEPLVGVIGGAAHWFHRRGPILSATISAATELAERPADEIARRVWSDARAALGLSAAAPPYRVIKERTATFAQTPAEATRRPSARTSLANLVLAGDWTATGLPATIDGAALSGETAARLALAIATENR